MNKYKVKVNWRCEWCSRHAVDLVQGHPRAIEDAKQFLPFKTEDYRHFGELMLANPSSAPWDDDPMEVKSFQLSTVESVPWDHSLEFFVFCTEQPDGYNTLKTWHHAPYRDAFNMEKSMNEAHRITCEFCGEERMEILKARGSSVFVQMANPIDEWKHPEWNQSLEEVRYAWNG